MSSFDYTKSKAYFRDKWVPFEEANLSVASSAVLYGLSVYTVLAVNQDPKSNQLYIFRLADHWRRLANSARIMGMADFEKSMPLEKFENVMLELLTKNEVHADTLIRATIFIDELMAGTRMNGLKNSFCAFIYPMGEILPRSGIHCCVSSWNRVSDNMIPARAKVNGSYANASLMKNEALLNGYDDAIALDASGHVAEGTVTNIFLVRAGKLVTPDSSTDILEGITRRSIAQLAAKLNIEYIERAIDRTELYVADEVFMVGSSARVVPVLSIDKRAVGNGEAGPVTKQLNDKYSRIQTAQESEFMDWLSPVY